MGQNNCCVTSKKQQIVDQGININTMHFQGLDYNRSSTYKKLETIADEIIAQNNIPSYYNGLICRIIAHKQQHLLRLVKCINNTEALNSFFQSLESIDFELLDSLHFNKNKRQLHKFNEIINPYNINKLDCLSQNQIDDYLEKGAQLLRSRKVGVIIMAGGSSYRMKESTLSSSSDKALMDIGLISKSCTLELICLRIKRLIDIVGTGTKNDRIPIIITTNEFNYQEIKNFVKQANYFGLPSSQISLSSQPMQTVLNSQGNILVDKNLTPIFYPTGSGGILQSLYSIDILKKNNWIDIEYFHFIGIENLLARPADPLFCGYCISQGSEICMKSIESSPNNDELPFYFILDNKIKVLTSNELEFYKNSKESDENLSQFIEMSQNLLNDVIVKRSFLMKLNEDPELKLKYSHKYHLIQRNTPFFDSQLMMEQYPSSQNGILFEKFIQDIAELCESGKVSCLEVSKLEQYAGLIRMQQIRQQIHQLSIIHSRWLGINDPQIEDRVEISPLISYHGENLEKYVEIYRSTKNWKYPVWIK